MITQAWVWQFEWTHPVAEPAAEQHRSPAFTVQYDAELWLGANWRDLAAAGVTKAKLMNRGLQATPTLDLQAALQDIRRGTHRT